MSNKSSEWIDYIELGLDSISLKCLENMKTVYQDENNVVLDENKHTRHISRRMHFVRNGEKCKMHKIDWCEGGLQLAEIGTIVK